MAYKYPINGGQGDGGNSSGYQKYVYLKKVQFYLYVYPIIM